MKPLVAKTTITINAPIEKVWEVMLNTARYPKWNPFVVEVETQGDVSKPGTRMLLRVRWLNGKYETSDEIIDEVSAPQDKGDGIKRACWSYRFTGLLSSLGLVKAIRFQWLEQQGSGPTTYCTREEFTGLLKNFVPLAKVQDGFERQAKGLKDYFKF